MSSKYEFVKVFNIGEHQVLVTKLGLGGEPLDDDDGDSFEVRISSKFDDAIVDVTLGGFTEEQHERLFDGFDQATAERAFSQLQSTYEEILG